MNQKEMVGAYVKLRDHKLAADKEFKKSMERVNEAMQVLEAKMMSSLNDTGANNIKTEFGTVYINTKHTATVKDRKKFLEHVVVNNLWDALDARANKTFIREQAEEGIEIPGVKLTSVKTVGVRRS